MTGGIAHGDVLPHTPIGPFDAAALAAFATASGDDNPLHLVAAVAAEAGFAAPPVHGVLLMAQIEPALAAWRPQARLARLTAQFLEPLLAGEHGHVTGRCLAAEDGRAIVRVFVRGPRRAPCLIGEATLVAREAP